MPSTFKSNTTQPHNPQLSYIERWYVQYEGENVSWKCISVQIDSHQLFVLNCTSISNATWQTNQTTQPHATIILLDQKLKDQRTKKVRNVLLQMLLSFQNTELTSLPALLLSQKQEVANTKHPNTQQSAIVCNEKWLQTARWDGRVSFVSINIQMM